MDRVQGIFYFGRMMVRYESFVCYVKEIIFYFKENGMLLKGFKFGQGYFVLIRF